MYKENNKGPRTMPVGHQTKPGPNPILLRLQQLAVVCSTEKNVSISVFSTYATAKQFALKELMRWGVKCFLKI